LRLPDWFCIFKRRDRAGFSTVRGFDVKPPRKYPAVDLRLCGLRHKHCGDAQHFGSAIASRILCARTKARFCMNGPSLATSAKHALTFHLLQKIADGKQVGVSGILCGLKSRAARYREVFPGHEFLQGAQRGPHRFSGRRAANGNKTIGQTRQVWGSKPIGWIALLLSWPSGAG